MANTRISNLAAIAALDPLLDLIDVGGAGSIEIRTGAPPATTETADSGTLLGTLVMSATAFGGAVDQAPGARATANAITSDTSADATGTAGHFRVKSGGAVVIIQGDITVSAGGGDLELDDINIVIGGTIAITAYTVDMPEA